MLGAVDAATIIHHHSTLAGLTIVTLSGERSGLRIIAYQWIATECDEVTMSMGHQKPVINLKF